MSGQKSERGEIRVLDNSFYETKYKRKGCRHSRLQVIKTTVQKLNLECVKPQRAGVIMYTVVEGAAYFGLGLDSRTHDLTDFGGGVVYTHDKNVINGALREFEEETLQIFETLKHEDIKNCPVVYDNNNLIIFMHLNVDPDEISSRFNEKYKEYIETNKKEPEVCGITWLTWEEFQESINDDDIMFYRVRKFLNRANDFSYLL